MTSASAFAMKRAPFRSAIALAAASVTLAGCLPHYRATNWPEPRQLGRDLRVFNAPEHHEVEPGRVEAPTGRISLRDALALALLGNPALQAFAWEVRAREAKTLQAGVLPNPELEVEVEEFGASDRHRGFDASQMTLQLGQVIELGGGWRARHEVAALERDLAAWDYEAERLDVLTDTSKAFVDLLVAEKRLALLEESLAVAVQILAAATARVQAGKVSSLEQTRAKVTLANRRVALERARRVYAAARTRLAAAWGHSATTIEGARGDLGIIQEPPPLADLVGRISENPDIARWFVVTGLRRAEVNVEQAKAVPDLTVLAGVRWFADTRDAAFTAGISMPIPVFDRNEGGKMSARYALAKAGREQRSAELRALAALETSYQELSASYADASGIARDVIPAAQLVFAATSQGYRQGKFGFLEVLDAQRTLLEARVNGLAALAGYHKALADVERLTGTPLVDGRQPPDSSPQENDDVR